MKTEQLFSIILASGSPRRQALLKELGIEFTTVLRDIDEQYPVHLHGMEVAIFLAKKKAAVYEPELTAGNVVITADTIVCIDDKILNKPGGHDEAFEMLQLLSGKEHQVITAVCISHRNFMKCFHVSTNVAFKPLSASEINFYIQQFRPFDKAGAYGIQEWIGLIGIDRIDGSYYNVVGLPVKELYEQLVALNIITGK